MPARLSPNATFLGLSDTYVTDQTMAALAGMKNLRRLTLLGTLVTDEGIKYLQDLTQLEVLDLYGVKITDKGLQAMPRSLSIPSKKPISIKRKYMPGTRDGRPSFL